MRRHSRPAVPAVLVHRIDQALIAVDEAGSELVAVAAGAPLRDRREAHARLRRAYDDADGLLRQATTMAMGRSYGEWGRWRHRLSALDTARQIHLLAEQDEQGLLPIGSVRAIDTGMSGPDMGDLQHGKSRPPGSLPTYGLDLEAVLMSPAVVRPRSGDRRQVPATESLEHPGDDPAASAAAARPRRVA